MRPLVIIGAGGFGREVYDVVAAMNAQHPQFHFLGFLDDRTDLDPRLPLLGPVDALSALDAAYVIGIGDPRTRARMDSDAVETGREPAVLIHPAATLGHDVVLGPGTVVAAGARLTTNIRIGRHGHVNLNATIGHDVQLGAFVTVSPQVAISGNVRVGTAVDLGTGCILLPGVVVGDESTVGAGAVVTKAVPSRTTVVGMPARTR